jgi:putative ABC transport system ATP-binding protein
MGGSALHVLRNVELTIDEGELVSIMGASGSGKSTLLNVLSLLDDYDDGTYHIGDTLIRDLGERRAAKYRNRFIGFVFQSFNLLAFKTALENVALPLYYQGVPRKERNRLALEYLRKVDLADRANHLPSKLSSGQKQRVAIARALIAGPKLLLARRAHRRARLGHVSSDHGVIARRQRGGHHHGDRDARSRHRRPH